MNRFMLNHRSLLVYLSVLAMQVQAQPAPQLGKAAVAEVAAAMTAGEKASLLVGMGFTMPGTEPPAGAEKEKVPGAAGRTRAIPRLGVPSLTLSDGPAGVRILPVRPGDTNTYYATAFPVATLVASTWDPESAMKVGAAMGEEAKEYGVDILLAPAMNIQRNPLGGRNFEYYSEDPLIAGSIAAGFVKGVQRNGVGVSVKHFAANNAEFNRMKLNTLVSERALREIYLRGFEIAVKEGSPWTVMAAYNLINGTYASHSHDLLSTILREEWGFKGFVMSDWFAGSNAVEQVNAGNDLIMPGQPEQAQAIVDAAKNGSISEAQLNLAVRRVLEVMANSPTFQGYPFSNRPDLKSNAQTCRTVAADGMVLLKNERATLPIQRGITVALFGNASYHLIAGGTGSGDVNKAYSVSLADGLANASYKMDASLKQKYSDFIQEKIRTRAAPPLAFMLPPPIPEMPLALPEIQRSAREADAAIFTLGRNSGEAQDRHLENDFLLSDTEKSAIQSVSKTFHAAGKKLIVLMDVCGPIEVVNWKDQADAILLTWQPGQEGGNAIADILSGAVNPSGRLAVTFPKRYQDVASSRTFPGKVLPPTGKKSVAPIPGLGDEATDALFGVPAEVVYDDDIYVGYRYYSTFGVAPAFEFGFGLSYSDFKFENVALSSKEFSDPITAAVTVKNTGSVAGREVVQLYLSAPTGQLKKPAIELKAFGKTRLLASGDSQKFEFKLSAADLASYDPASSAWIVEPGSYKVSIGASSRQLKQSATFKVPKMLVAEKAHSALVPQVKIPLLQRPR
jgi:beta-glucosidase